MTTNNAEDKLTTKVHGKEFTQERIFNAPRELVFKAFSEAEHLKRWFGPKGWPLVVCTVDFRPGGVWHYCMKCVDEKQVEHYGTEAWGKAIYREIVANERIIYVDSFSDAEGNDAAGMPEGVVTLTFVEYNGKTKLINNAKYATEEALKSVMDMGMLQGITETWENLDTYLEEIQ